MKKNVPVYRRCFMIVPQMLSVSNCKQMLHYLKFLEIQLHVIQILSHTYTSPQVLISETIFLSV